MRGIGNGQEKPTEKPMSDRRLFATYLDIKERLDRYFVNDNPMLTCGAKTFTISDVVTMAVQSNTNMYLVGSRGTGKTLLAEVIRRAVFNDDGFYLRGDVNMNIKELFMRLNLQGKTEEEIYQQAKSVAFLIMVLDELNRVPGVIQNQFLFVLDGYMEHRGKTYPLGIGDYMLAIATGNPMTNGEYTGVFDEDSAMLDRIPLVINVDEIEHAPGDIARIIAEDTEKNRIVTGDLSKDVVASYRYLTDVRHGDLEAVAAVSLLAEFIYPQFRYVTVGGKRLDKLQEQNWRDLLLGQHAGGSTISYVSDVSVRMLKSAARLGFTMFKIASIETELLNRKGMKTKPIEYTDFLDSSLNALKLGLTYDRRFIPAEFPQQIGKTHTEMLDGAFRDLSSSLDTEVFQDATLMLLEFHQALRKADDSGMQKVMASASKALAQHPIVKAAHGIMDSIVRKREAQRKNALLREALAEDGEMPPQ